MPDLKPCPFCGGTKLKVERKSSLAGFNGLDERVDRHTFSVRIQNELQGLHRYLRLYGLYR